MARLSAISKFTMELDSAGIVYRELLRDGEMWVVIEATKGPANGGYGGMSTVLIFDGRSGALVCIETWGPLSQSNAA